MTVEVASAGAGTDPAPEHEGQAVRTIPSPRQKPQGGVIIPVPPQL